MKEDLESKIENNGFLQWFGRIPFVKELTLASLFSGFSLVGCSRDSSNPVAPKINQPPETEIVTTKISYDNSSLPKIEFTVNGWDEDGYIRKFFVRIDNDDWYEFSATKMSGTKKYFSNLEWISIDKFNHIISAKSVDNSWAEDQTPAEYLLVYQNPSTSPTPPPPVPQPSQQITTLSDGKVVINSTDNNTYTLVIRDKITLQPLSGIKIFYQEEKDGKIVMAEDPSSNYFSSLDVLVSTSLLSTSYQQNINLENKLTSGKDFIFVGTHNPMPEYKSEDLELIKAGVRASELPEIYKQNDYFIQNKEVLNFVFNKTGYSWAATLNNFREDIINNTDNMITILNQLQQLLAPTVPIQDYTFDVYRHKTMGVLVHSVNYSPIPIIHIENIPRVGTMEGWDSYVFNNVVSYYVQDPGWWGRQNHGNEDFLFISYMKASNGYGESDIFVKFDLSDFNTSLYNFMIYKVNLKLYLASGYNGSSRYPNYAFETYPVKDSWDENSITFENQPPVITDYIPMKTKEYTSADTLEGTTYSFDVTNIFADWLSGKVVNNGLRIDLILSQYGQFSIYSSENLHTVSRPKLEVEYSKSRK